MLERLTTSARVIVRAGQEEAARLGAPAVEAEHLLLAMSALGGDAAGALQEEADLDHKRLLQLLGAERDRSLSFAGVDPAAFPVPVPKVAAQSRQPGSLHLATSAKSVLERAVKDAAKRGTRFMGEVDLLVALLRAQSGTVPRIIALAGLDRETLIARLAERRAS